jgi:hypothetical protein
LQPDLHDGCQPRVGTKSRRNAQVASRGGNPLRRMTDKIRNTSWMAKSPTLTAAATVTMRTMWLPHRGATRAAAKPQPRQRSRRPLGQPLPPAEPGAGSSQRQSRPQQTVRRQSATRTAAAAAMHPRRTLQTALPMRLQQHRRRLRRARTARRPLSQRPLQRRRQLLLAAWPSRPVASLKVLLQL